MQQRQQFTRRTWLQIVAAGAGAAVCDELAAKNSDFPSQVDGLGEADAERVGSLVSPFLKKHGVPGLSWAVARRGKLTATGAFGWADTSDRTPVRPTHLFRIASVSKPITAVTILKLVEEGSVGLAHRVFARNGLLRKYCDDLASDPVSRGRLEAITVQHLLEHTSGGWGNAKNDPMFAQAALGKNHSDLIRWTLRNMPLEDMPGTKYAYSNFGYCLLGRLIEALTDSTYFEAVQKKVLRPAGVSRMRIGHRRGDAPNEVRYYGNRQQDPYGDLMDVARMDAHGGWIASASDLVRLAVHVDGFANPDDLLSKSTRVIMTTPSTANDHYAKGWRVNKSDNWWHMGGFIGGSAILVRIHEGDCWALLVNGRGHDSTYFSDLDQFGWTLRSAIKDWPQHNLFGS